MRWDDLDLEKGLWIIPPEFNKKGRGQSFGREEWLPLTDTMIEVINGVPRKGLFVIGGQTPITAGSKLLAKIKKLSDIEVDDRGNSWTFHGFRRSMASSSLGALNTRVIDLIQGRVETGAAAHYYQGDYLEAKKLGLCEWELIIRGSSSGKPANYTRTKQQHVKPIFEAAVRQLWFEYKDLYPGDTSRQRYERIKKLHPKSEHRYLQYKQNGKGLFEESPYLKAWSLSKPPINILESIVKAGPFQNALAVRVYNE